MVKLLIGKKGTGKTKKLIALANEAVAASSGNVVVIEKGSKLTYDVTHKARLIDTEQYTIYGYDMLYGFLSGICAGNYDVTDILVDSTFKIAPEVIRERFSRNNTILFLFGKNGCAMRRKSGKNSKISCFSVDKVPNLLYNIRQRFNMRLCGLGCVNAF